MPGMTSINSINKKNPRFIYATPLCENQRLCLP
jgi:hypothetical protein